MEEYLDNENNDSGIFTDYAIFKREIRQIFKPTNEDAMAERVLIDII